jgi:hypothetical protein
MEKEETGEQREVFLTSEIIFKKALSILEICSSSIPGESHIVCWSEATSLVDRHSRHDRLHLSNAINTGVKGIVS